VHSACIFLPSKQKIAPLALENTNDLLSFSFGMQMNLLNMKNSLYTYSFDFSFTKTHSSNVYF